MTTTVKKRPGRKRLHGPFIRQIFDIVTTTPGLLTCEILERVSGAYSIDRIGGALQRLKRYELVYWVSANDPVHWNKIKWYPTSTTS